MLNSGIELLLAGNNLQRLISGLLVTVRIAFISITASMVLGIFFGIIMNLKSRRIYFFCRIYLEALRIIPIIVWFFIIYFGFARVFDINITGEATAVGVFIMWGTAEMGDLVRGALSSLPKHQLDSAQAIGLDVWTIYRYVLIPQAARRILPAAINLATRMIKTTSLVVMIGVVEVVKVGQQIIESSILSFPAASFWIYGLIFLFYFFICYPLSKLARRLEIEWSR